MRSVIAASILLCVASALVPRQPSEVFHITGYNLDGSTGSHYIYSEFTSFNISKVGHDGSDPTTCIGDITDAFYNYGQCSDPLGGLEFFEDPTPCNDQNWTWTLTATNISETTPALKLGINHTEAGGKIFGAHHVFGYARNFNCSMDDSIPDYSLLMNVYGGPTEFWRPARELV